MAETAATAETQSRARIVAAAITPARACSVLACGLIAGFLIPGVEAGLGCAVALSGTVVVAVASKARTDTFSLAMASAAFILAFTPLFRDADWLVALNLSVAAVFAVVAVTGAGSWTAMAIAGWQAVAGLMAAPLAIMRSALAAVPNSSFSAAAPLRGLALGSGLVLIFGLLFASADSAFAQMVEGLVPSVETFDLFPSQILTAVIVVAITGSLVLLPASETRTRTGAKSGVFRPAEWALALGPVLALFSLFVAIQFTVLFGGNDHVLETAGLTYSEYAREGFTQLLVVAILALALVASAWRWSVADTRGAQLALRLLLGSLCALALVILVSALHRLDLYADAFGATRVRLVAGLACVAIGGVLVMTIIAVARWRSGWVPRAVLGFFAALSIGFTALNPDALVASRNVDRAAEDGRFDTAYNSRLSADATPELLALPPALELTTLAAQREELAGSDGWRGFNFARAAAREELLP